MKTPIEEAIEILKGSEDKTFKVSDFIEVLNNILPKEREHIEEAYRIGSVSTMMEDYKTTSNLYFNNKYNK